MLAKSCGAVTPHLTLTHTGTSESHHLDEGVATEPFAYATLPCHHRSGPQHVRRLHPARIAHSSRTPAKSAIPSAPVTSGSNQPLNPPATVGPT